MTSPNKQNVLFVCTQNKWRSPTAERVFKELFNTRSVGISRYSKRHINSDDIRWADVIIVMQQKHHNHIRCRFPALTKFKPINILDIADDFCYMDNQLIALLHCKMAELDILN